ncbi:hypothetical protein V8T50_23665 [Vibrio parahaemolyticus]
MSELLDARRELMQDFRGVIGKFEPQLSDWVQAVMTASVAVM